MGDRGPIATQHAGSRAADAKPNQPRMTTIELTAVTDLDERSGEASASAGT
jgi:hypothetical protein